jgi:hypothetical protein
MTAHPPPVPPDQQSDKGPAASTPGEAKSQSEPDAYRPQNRNLGEQGRQGNVKQNTTNKGLQQDR